MRAEVEAKTEALLALSDPMRESMAQIAEECGLSPGQVNALARRLARDFLPLQRSLDSVNNAEMAKLYRYQSWRVLQAISEEDIEKAGLKEKAIAAAVLTDKSLLLDGQPTQVLSIKELGNLDELSSMLLHEMKRRGLEPAANEGTQQVTSTDQGLLGTSQDPATGFTSGNQFAPVVTAYEWGGEPR